ncbi:SET domain-containing protein [Lentinula detonsa]|uniref:SET domain-containing protein n=1 Tax=Lentinula detonsa TaxID=2804962 RepID=A0A9W8NSL9_9AGAR|nr:SET domain-containing protein [Lentinula detonsa]
MKLVYSAMMQENTSLDEPLAPPIIIINQDDLDATATTTPPWEFYYTNEMLLGRSVPPPSRINLTGCDCLGGQCHLNKSQCTCYLKQESFTAGYGVTGFMYHAPNQTLKSNGLPVFECNSLCACSEQCTNRVVSRGRKIPLSLQKTPRKGWGVFARCLIPKGTFIGIYSGELLGHEESEERALKYDEFGRTYLFDIDWWYINQQYSRNNNSRSRKPCKYTVDAYHAGNFTRFLNHSCDPNSALTPVYIDMDDIERPLLTVFSKRPIQAGEEITFSYSGDPDFDDDEDEEEEDKEEEGEGGGGEGKEKEEGGDGDKGQGTIWRLE